MACTAVPDRVEAGDLDRSDEPKPRSLSKDPLDCGQCTRVDVIYNQDMFEISRLNIPPEGVETAPIVPGALARARMSALQTAGGGNPLKGALSI